MIPDRPLTLAERDELRVLSEVSLKGVLCSRLLACYLECVQRDTGVIPTTAAIDLANRIEQWDRKGLHMSPGVVAMILRELGGVARGHGKSGRSGLTLFVRVFSQG